MNRHAIMVHNLRSCVTFEKVQYCMRNIRESVTYLDNSRGYRVSYTQGLTLSYALFG